MPFFFIFFFFFKYCLTRDHKIETQIASVGVEAAGTNSAVEFVLKFRLINMWCKILGDHCMPKLVLFLFRICVFFKLFLFPMIVSEVILFFLSADSL